MSQPTAPTPRNRPPAITSYWERTHWPLQGLYFLLPLILVYEVGLALLATGDDIVARGILRAVFELLGVTGYYLPGLLVIVFLLAAHFIRGDPWQPEFRLLGLMAGEAMLLALPLFVFAQVLVREPVIAEPLARLLTDAGEAVSKTGAGAAGVAGVTDWTTGLVFSIGAGIYEELLFRLIAIALLHLALVDLIGLPRQHGGALAVFASALAFALYHFEEPNPLQWAAFWAGFDIARFIFYLVAGIYLAGVYLLRGFGIVAATHAIYNILVFTFVFLQRPPAG
ncbi:MAG: CPBP family intramembrane glutamic endopeptidase [Phycisphaeraceae bacterium]